MRISATHSSHSKKFAAHRSLTLEIIMLRVASTVGTPSLSIGAVLSVNNASALLGRKESESLQDTSPGGVLTPGAIHANRYCPQQAANLYTMILPKFVPVVSGIVSSAEAG
jgi:hypothetical protein